MASPLPRAATIARRRVASHIGGTLSPGHREIRFKNLEFVADFRLPEKGGGPNLHLSFRTLEVAER